MQKQHALMNQACRHNLGLLLYYLESIYVFFGFQAVRIAA